MPRLPSLRIARTLVLLSYLLVVATSLAAPWLEPAAFGPVCSATPSTGSETGHGLSGPLHCALCLPPATPPPVVFDFRVADAGPQLWHRVVPQPHTGPRRTAPPPARGPPSI